MAAAASNCFKVLAQALEERWPLLQVGGTRHTRLSFNRMMRSWIYGIGSCRFH